MNEQKKKKKKIICGNCGKYGHTYKTCTSPVMSLGIIAFRRMNDNTEFLLIRRKDTLGYIEFLRGKYGINDKKYITNLFSEMTKQEIYKLKNWTFDDIWKNLWMDQNSKQYKKEYEKSKERFNFVMNCDKINIKQIISQIGIFWEEPEWGFPKGRRNIRENDLDCAIREFHEETGITIDDISILSNLDPIEEIFYGSNNVKYKHIYFLAYSNMIKNPIINQDDIRQVSEVSKISWLSYEEAKNKIRPYNIEKLKVLEKINNILKMIYNENHKNNNHNSYNNNLLFI